MGSGIAAHLANLGFDVTLLEQTREMADEKLAHAASQRPPHFYLSGTSKTIRTGSISEDLEAVEQADWVCEAIIEKLDAKQALFETLDPLIREDALISTNTSGLQISLLTEGRSESFRRKFLGTHFFNPPRYLKLLELIPTNETDAAVVEATTKFFHDKAARRVVVVKDTPGFIANRYGMWSMFHAIHVAEKLRLSIEQVDAITGPFLGRPKSGSFRLNDLVGLDIMQDIAQNLIERCPHDPGTSQLDLPKSMEYLIEKGWIGNKVRQGYYKKEGNQFVAFDLERHTYNEVQEPNLSTLKELERLPIGERLSKALQDTSEVGEFLRLYLKPTLQYAVSIKDEISHNVRDFDRVMQWGFGWQDGPFAMIDAIGADNLDLSTKPFYQIGQIQDNAGIYFSPKPEPEFATITDYPIVDQQPGFNVRDMGDGVEAISITNKMGVIDPVLVRSLLSYLKSGRLGRIVLTSEAKVFSAGFDLKFFNTAVEAEQFDEIDSAIADFQRLNTMIGNIPSVAAVWGFCIGGGFELAAGCSLIAAHPETQIGLPEALVGLVPGGAGIGVMRLRLQSNGTKGVVEAAKLIATGGLSANADDARKLGFLRDEDITVYHPDRLLTEAKKLVLNAKPLVRQAWQEVGGPIKGMIDQMQKDLIAAGSFSEYDAQINDKVKNVLTSASSFEDAVERERHAFVDLCKEGRSHARMKHMVDTGKPLRN